MANVTKVGFIGLGTMGGHMARALARRYDVVLLDRNSELALKTRNAIYEEREGAHSYTAGDVHIENVVEKVARRCEAVITMLPSPAAVREVHAQLALYAQRKLQHSEHGLVLAMDCSTTAPADALAVAHFYRSRSPGLNFLDAPVSGGVGGAQSQTLSFLVGGDLQAIKHTAEPILNTMGKRIIHCGTAHGSGQAAKLSNNLLLAITMSGVCEAYSLAQRLGLDEHVFASVVRASSGQCWSNDAYNPVPNVLPTAPASRNYKKGFAAELMVKDLRLALSASECERGDTWKAPMTQQALQLYNTLAQHDRQLDIGALFRLVYNGRDAAETRAS